MGVGVVVGGESGTNHDTPITHVQLWFRRDQSLFVFRHDLHQTRHHLPVLGRAGPKVTEISYRF